MSFPRRLFNISCYLLYTMAVLVLLLWYQFPAAAVKARLESELQGISPGLQWHIGKVALALPADIRFSEVSVGAAGSRKKEKFSIDFLSLRPDLSTYLKKREWSAQYRLGILEGTVTGLLSRNGDGKSLRCEGSATGIRLEGLEKNMAELERSVSGTLSGSFTGTAAIQGPGIASLQGDFSVVKGAVSFQEPVLGMEQLAFNKVSARLKYTPEKINVAGGRIESRLLAGDFSGTVTPGGTIALSTLKLNGNLVLRPEFLSGLGNDAAVKLLKGRLQKGRLPFAINGTLEAPGIVFAGLPADFNQQLQGRD